MALGIATSIIFILLLSPPIIALILCLTLIKKKPYKKLSQKQIYAGFWQRFITAGDRMQTWLLECQQVVESQLALSTLNQMRHGSFTHRD